MTDVTSVENPVGPEEKELVAVGAIVVNDETGQILVAQETQDKPEVDKRSGDWSIFWETAEKEESYELAVRRLIREEVGDGNDIIWDPVQDWLGDYGPPGFCARVYVLHWKRDSTRSFSAVDSEVINHRWIEPAEIRNMQRRPGVLEPIEDFEAGKRGVTCQDLSPAYRPQ